MASIGRKLLSVFADIEEEYVKEATNHTASGPAISQPVYIVSQHESEKFNAYFDQLIQDANLPGPDYFEFSKMVEAMKSIPDERTRFISAYAGLTVQGLDKDKLLRSARDYIQVLDDDSKKFSEAINSAVLEKVELKKGEIQEKSNRIQELTKEINDLNNQILVLGNEINTSEEKIQSNMNGYTVELAKCKDKINSDIQKINNLI